MSAGPERSTLNDNLEQFPVLDLKDGLCCISLSKESQETFALEGENLESRKEEKKPPDSSLSPRQPMKCLAGNGRTGWTLDCSLWMCGTPGTPGAAWADGLDAPAPPFLPSHWPGKCTELSQGIERDQPREVKKEGRREVRQQASSTKLLCKQGITPVSSKVPTEVAAAVVPVVWASGIPGKWKRAEPVECECKNLPRKPMAKMIDEKSKNRMEEKKPPDSSLSPRQPMNCLAGNRRTGWTLDCSLCMCGSPLRNSRNSWCRLGRWIGRPSPSVPAQPLGPCPVVALPALQWDVAWKVHRAEPRD
ncbi:uncharacterized protein LOC127461525 isoform X2 [Manacus candei]|uniref:uncharacterized protein LOC127461525 isoform X2 n=1 Tax=Manacus candei TaxID=415023 RepID=UPI0022279D09|nr:uncharacterized protein LOC127461525 isoform X2 [Manacus candei]